MNPWMRASLLVIAGVVGWYAGGFVGFLVGLVVDIGLGLVAPGAPGRVTTAFWGWLQLPGMLLGAVAGAAVLEWWLRKRNR